ncbi:hypothetical protein GM3709_872 [Geminocystis sp. NIES-3709]|nr:hypothetical protein GM3709_872 [Geminocystis sp. NIES-3709]
MTIHVILGYCFNWEKRITYNQIRYKQTKSIIKKLSEIFCEIKYYLMDNKNKNAGMIYKNQYIIKANL